MCIHSSIIARCQPSYSCAPLQWNGFILTNGLRTDHDAYADGFFSFFNALYENHVPTALARKPRVPTTIPIIPPVSKSLLLLEVELELLPIVAVEAIAVGVWEPLFVNVWGVIQLIDGSVENDDEKGREKGVEETDEVYAAAAAADVNNHSPISNFDIRGLFLAYQTREVISAARRNTVGCRRDAPATETVCTTVTVTVAVAVAGEYGVHEIVGVGLSLLWCKPVGSTVRSRTIHRSNFEHMVSATHTLAIVWENLIATALVISKERERVLTCTHCKLVL